MDASLMKASALRLRFSQSLASRRQRLSQAMVPFLGKLFADSAYQGREPEPAAARL